MSNKLKLLGRENLKGFFKDGERPHASNFDGLIDSVVNRLDDGFSKTREEGMILAPDPDPSYSDKVISIFGRMNDDHPEWSISLDMENIGRGLKFVEVGPENKNDTRLFLNNGGNVGIGTEEPRATLEVDGILGVKSRVGTHDIGAIPADGQWHTVLNGLNGSNGFELIAHVGKDRSGKHALLHATALSTFGKSKSKIRKTQAHYGFCWNRIKIKWTGETENYGIMMKTGSNYGAGQTIRYSISSLWNNDIMQLLMNETNESSEIVETSED
ncbi:MAG: hypothetical protein ACI837_002429 [Crocinitomicaceae bacterium]|jgi:hypothetical protein